MRVVRQGLGAAVCVLSLVAFSSAEAATVSIINADGPGEGFNDSTPASPVGGNTGTTVGAQRLVAFQYAADLWGARIDSAVTIVVSAQFDPLFCTQNSAVLGQAGPEFLFANFPAALASDTWYVSAQADAIAGFDLNLNAIDISATFNSELGQAGCFDGSFFYLGLDGNAAGDPDFVTVLAHELGHGLGFLTASNAQTGELNQGLSDAYTNSLEDHSTGKLWPVMNNTERAASAIDGSETTSDLHWVGGAASAHGALILNTGIGAGHVEIYAPNPFTPGSSVSHFARTLSPDELMEPRFTTPNHNLDMTLAAFSDMGYPSIFDCGDANNDTSVTATDALFALNAAVGARSCLESLCDVTNDGRVTATDALALLQFAVGSIANVFCGLS